MTNKITFENLNLMIDAFTKEHNITREEMHLANIEDVQELLEEMNRQELEV